MHQARTSQRASARTARTGSGLSTVTQGRLAAALDQAQAALDGARTDLLLLFIAPQFEDELPAIVERAFDRAEDAVIIGCSAGGVIGAAPRWRTCRPSHKVVLL